MKSIKLFSVLCVLMAIVGACEQPLTDDRNEFPSGTGDLSSLLFLQMEEPSTKVNVDGDSGACRWTRNDHMNDTIAVWITSSSGTSGYRAAVVNQVSLENPSMASVSLSLGNGEKRANYAVYPASAIDAAYYGEGNVSNSNPPRIVYNTFYNLEEMSLSEIGLYARIPMVAANSDNETARLDFCHVGGVLQLSLTDVPSGTNRVRVTFVGMNDVTGTYEVLDGPGTSSARTKLVSGGGRGNVIEFKLPTVTAGAVVLNVPLPCGDYGSLSGIGVTVSGGTEMTRIKRAEWPYITHSQGKKMTCSFGSESNALYSVEFSTPSAMTLWKNQQADRPAAAYNESGSVISGAVVTYEVVDGQSVAEVDGSSGKVTALSAGTATVRASTTVGGISKSAEYKVHVNEATIALNPGELTGRAGKTGKITADVTYTRNGDWSVPVVSWTSGNSTVATLKDSATLPGESNAVTFGSAPGATTTITAEILAGTDIVATASCNTSIISAAYVPGKFSVSPTKKVWFASGNLLFKADKNGDNWTNRRWEFAQNQWDYYAVDAKESWNQGDGTDKVIDLFAWASNGVQNPYDASQKCYEPFDRRTDALNFPDVCWVWWREYDMYDYPEAEPEYNILPTWLKTGGFGPLANDNGLGITISSSEVERIQNFGGECQPEEYEAWRVFVNDLNFKDALINSSDNYDYGWNAHDDVKKYCEWGLHLNADGSENTNTPLAGTWYTLSKNEWEYLYFSRPKAALLRSAATIYDSDGERFVNGMILLPDNWEIPESCTFTPIINDGNPLNIYIAGTGATNGFVLNGRWEDMEAAGAVFIPELVYKRASSSTVLREWRYWTSTACLGDAFSLIVTMDSYWLAREINTRDDERNSRLPVRLVHD